MGQADGERTIVHQGAKSDPWLIVRTDARLVRPADFHALDANGLRELRLRALEELAAGLRGGAGRAHLERVAALVGKVEQRLERFDD